MNKRTGKRLFDGQTVSVSCSCWQHILHIWLGLWAVED